MNAYIKFGEILSICSQDIERKQNLDVNQGHNSGTNVEKMTCNNPKLDLVNVKAYIKFGENMSICSQNIEWKRYFGVNQGTLLFYKFGKNDMPQSQARSCQYECISKI